MFKKVSLLLLFLASTATSNGAPITAYWDSSSTDPLSDSLLIEGPEGVREYKLGFKIDVPGPVLVNQFGVAAGSGESTADFFAVYAVYSLGPDPGPPAAGVEPGLLIGQFGLLHWPLDHPEISLPNPPPPAEVTSVSDSGVVTVVVTYEGFDLNTDLARVERVSYQWQVQSIPEPSAWSLTLAAALIFFGLYRKRTERPLI